MEEKPNLTSTNEHLQSSSNLASFSLSYPQISTPDSTESNFTQNEENTSEIPETMDSQEFHTSPTEVLQNTCTNIHIIIPKTSIFQKIEKLLVFINSAWAIRILGKPLFSISIRYLYFESLLPLLFSDLNNYFVRQICSSCFANTVALRSADFIMYFAIPELPLKRVIERIIDELRDDQLFIVAIVQHKIGGNHEEIDCLLDLMWSLYGSYGDEVAKIAAHVHFCFIHHGSRTILDIENLLYWGCNRIAFSKLQLT